MVNFWFIHSFGDFVKRGIVKSFDIFLYFSSFLVHFPAYFSDIKVSPLLFLHLKFYPPIFQLKIFYYFSEGSSSFNRFITVHMWHSGGKGPIWSFLEMEILRKIGKMVKKSKKKGFSLFWRVRPPETLLCW